MMIKALSILLLVIAFSSSSINAQIEKFSPVEVGMSLNSLNKATQRLQEHPEFFAPGVGRRVDAD